MDSNQLFWATGINNNQLSQDAISAIGIFQNLSTKVQGHLQDITNAYARLHDTARVKFTNPVDPKMITEIKSQISDLGKTIDAEILKLGQFSAAYDKSMTTIGKSANKIGQNLPKSSPLTPMVNGIKIDVANASNEITYMERMFKNAFGRLIAYGSIRWAGQFASDVIKVRGEFEQLRVTIDAFIGSAEKGAKIFNELTSLAVRSPFQLMDITNSAKQLLAYGVAADDVVESIKKMSDVSAGSGQSIRDISYLYGTSLTQGRLYARDLFQFANRGVPIYQELSKVMGITTEKLSGMVKAGKVGFPQLQQAFENMTAAGGLYYGLSDKLAETVYGQVSNLKDKWQIAMDEMGASTEGFVTLGIEATTALIKNWEDVVTVLADVIIAIGTYKAAMAITTIGTGTQQYVYNYKLAESLSVLTSAELKETLAKNGLTMGSIEYTNAVRSELATRLASNRATLSAMDAEIVSNRILYTEKKALLLQREGELLIAKQQLAFSVKNGDANLVEAATNEVNTASTNLNAAATEKNAAAKSLLAGKRAKNTVLAETETISETVNTASKNANAASTGFLTIAQNKLAIATKNLTAWMSANPYTVAAIALAGLAVVIYNVATAETAMEEGARKAKDAMDQVNAVLEERKKRISDLVDKIKDQASSEVEVAIAYNQLISLSPTVFKNLDIETIKRENVNKKIKEQNGLYEKQKMIKIWAARDDAKSSMDKAKSKMDAEKINQSAGFVNSSDAAISSMALAGYTNDYEANKKIYDDLNKTVEEYKKGVYDAAKNSKKAAKDTPMDYDYWGDMKKAAEDSLKAIDEFTLTKLKKGDMTGIDSDTIYQYTKAAHDLELSRQKLKTYDTKEVKPKAASTSENDRRQKIADNENAITKIITDSEADRAQKVIDAKRDGYAKEKAQIDLNYEKAYAKAIDNQNRVIKLARETEKAKWQLTAKKGSTFTSKITGYSSLSAEEKSASDTGFNAAEEVRANEEQKLREKTLAQLSDYKSKMDKIDQEHTDNVLALSNTRTEDNAKETDEAIAKLDDIAKKAKASLKFDDFKEQVDWGTIFGDLDKVPLDKIKDLREQLSNLMSSDTGSMSVEDIKAAAEALAKLDEVSINKDSFNELKKSIKDYTKASNDASKAQEKLTKLEKQGKKGTQEYKEAEDELGNAQDRRYVATTKMGKSFEKTKEKTDEFSKSLSTLGDTIGGDIGKGLNTVSSIITVTMSGISGIVQLVQISSTAMTATTASASASMQALEKASVILAIISAAIQLTMLVINMFAGESSATKHYNELKASLEGYIEVLDKLMAKQEDLMESLAGGAAQLASDEIVATLEKEIAAYRQLAEAAANAGASMGSHSYKYRTNKALKDYWDDISETVGYAVDDINDFYSMSSEDLEKIMTENSYAWSQINGNIRDYLEKIIDATADIEDALDNAKEAVTGLSFDEAISGLDDLLMDADSTMEEVADNFEDYMTTAMLNIVKSNYLTKALSDWYDKFYAYSKSGDTLTEDEVSDLQTQYEDIFKTAQDSLQQMADIAGVDLSSDSSNSTSGAISSMTEETADILTAQFSAIRLNVADILLSLYKQYNLLELMSNDIHQISLYTASLPEMLTVLKYFKSTGIKAL